LALGTQPRLGKWDIVRRRNESLWDRLRPPQLFVGSFAVLVLLGTLGFKLLPGLYTGEPLSWLDALFTSASAVCVTGLIVEDTATYFTRWGQVYILLLIQIGGLGIITFTSLIIIALGRRLSLRQEALAGSRSEITPQVKTKHLLRDVALFTLTLELIGAVLLLVAWRKDMPLGEAMWHAVFHSISSFCNAGFSTFSDSMVSWQHRPMPLMIVMLLIVIGGLGFLTLEELYLHARARQQRRMFRLSLHSRIVLVMTGVLIAGGAALYAMLEWNGALGRISPGGRVVNALFMSVTARTAGFNTIDYSTARDATNFLTVILMFIGGSPGSMAGGIKTTTIALIGLLAWSRMRGEEIPSVASRSVPEETIQRAVGLFVVAFGVVTACIFMIAAIEADDAVLHHFLHYMFEAASAFNTVGLSMGVTADLSETSKVIVILMMFVGRVGPLSFAAALARMRRHGDRDFRYAYDVVVG
jgi:trk system potassium uptake protein